MATAAELEYLRWLTGVEERILALFRDNASWIDLAVSEYPNLPDSALARGKQLHDDWAALAAEVRARASPPRYRDFHSEYAKAVNVAADGTALFYESIKAGDMKKAGDAVVLQRRAEEALRHSFQPTPGQTRAVVQTEQPIPAGTPRVKPTVGRTATERAIRSVVETVPAREFRITATVPTPAATSAPNGASFLTKHTDDRARMRGVLVAAGLAVLMLAVGARALTKSDTGRPNVVSFDFDPKVINTAEPDRVITFTARITGNLGGAADPGSEGTICANFAQFRSPSGNQQVTVVFTARDRVSGDGRDSIYVSTITMPRYSEAGVWKLSYLKLQDNAGNARKIPLDEMTSLGFPGELHVESTDEAMSSY